MDVRLQFPDTVSIIQPKDPEPNLSCQDTYTNPIYTTLETSNLGQEVLKSTQCRSEVVWAVKKSCLVGPDTLNPEAQILDPACGFAGCKVYTNICILLNPLLKKL